MLQPLQRVHHSWRQRSGGRTIGSFGWTQELEARENREWCRGSPAIGECSPGLGDRLRAHGYLHDQGYLRRVDGRHLLGSEVFQTFGEK